MQALLFGGPCFVIILCLRLCFAAQGAIIKKVCGLIPTIKEI